MIHVEKLVKRFGLKTVLRNLEFHVAAGEIVGLIGPNGAGKTTLLRILSSLSQPTFGKVLVGGYRLPQQAIAVRYTIGVLSHQPILYGDLSAEQNLAFYGSMYGVVELQTRITQVLKIVGMNKRRRDFVRTYSRGMQQRLAIARAIIHDPQLLLLDEPYTGLDQDAAEMLDSILRDVTDQGRTVVMTSHDLLRISDLATRFDVLTRGKIAASTQRADLPKDGLLAFYRKSLQADKAAKQEVAHAS